jgi:hypothetical protein
MIEYQKSFISFITLMFFPHYRNEVVTSIRKKRANGIVSYSINTNTTSETAPAMIK